MRFLVRFAIRILPLIVGYILCAIRKRKGSIAREENQKQERADAAASGNLRKTKTPVDFVKSFTEGGALMEIEELTTEQAKELFDSTKGQEAWKVTGDLVGPPIEFAYQGDYIARLLLCGTLGAIFVRKDKDLGLEGIASLEKRGVTAYDKAVCILIKGIYYEVFQEYAPATECYKKAIETCAGTYSAYYRLASIAYGLSGFDVAETFCTQGLSQLEKDKLCDQNILKKIEIQFREFLDQISKKIADKKDKEVYQGKPLEEIWESENEMDLVIALDEYVVKKCRYGDAMESLSAPERVFYITQSLEMEVNNGGFSQYFFNSSGDFANEVVNAFVEIGAIKTAEICKKAVAIFGEKVPADRFERDDVISDNEELEEILCECDDAFYKYPDALTTLNYEYVMKNKAFFT